MYPDQHVIEWEGGTYLQKLSHIVRQRRQWESRLFDEAAQQYQPQQYCVP